MRRHTSGSTTGITDQEHLLALLPNGIILLTRSYAIRYANAAAEDFLGESMAVLKDREISQFLYPAPRIHALIDTAFAAKSLIKEYDVAVGGLRAGIHMANLQVLPLENGDEAVLVIDDRGISQHMPLRESARLTSGMASILAHEVKNPLSGIRGAAQLLQKAVTPEDRKLTQLIVSEVDRIKGVIEEMEIFSNPADLKTESVNIHEVLQYVKLLAEQGFARHVTFREVYDPSIPHVAGHRNLLIQMFLNLIKNASEALPPSGNAIITLSTYYQSGFRIKTPGSTESRSLPVAVRIEDNGPGIPPELRESIFAPFVTTKEGGKGLGLAVVAKIMADHGGAVVLEEGEREGTRFKIFLPTA